MDQEVFYLIEVPGGDRRYIQRDMTPGRYAQLHRDYPGTRIFKVVIFIPLAGRTEDAVLSGVPREWVGEFGEGKAD